MEEERKHALGNVRCRLTRGPARRMRYLMSAPAACSKASLPRKLIDSVAGRDTDRSEARRAPVRRTLTVLPLGQSPLLRNADSLYPELSARVCARGIGQLRRCSMHSGLRADQSSTAGGKSLTLPSCDPATQSHRRTTPTTLSCSAIRTGRSPGHVLRGNRGVLMNSGSTEG